MRLLLVTQDFPPDVGGTQTYSYELARRFADRCEAFAVLAPSSGERYDDAALPFPVHRVAATYDSFSFLAFPVLRKLLLQERFDTTFHVQWPSVLTAWPLRGRTSLRHIFTAAHGRELLLQPFKGFQPVEGIYDLLRRRALTVADGIFPVSSYTEGLVRNIVPHRTGIRVVHNGTDPEHFQPANGSRIRSRYDLGNSPVVLSVTRLVERKGIDTVILAMALLKTALPDARYLVVGVGPERPHLEALIKENGLHDRVVLAGRVLREDLPACYGAANVFVLPSREQPPHVEGFGVVFLEANACGLPVIGARTGGIPDAVQDGVTGLLVPPNEPVQLAAAIRRLLENPAEAARMGQAGRQRVLTSGTWDHVADHILNTMRAMP